MSSRAIYGPQGELAVQQTGSGTGLPVVFLHADAGRAAQWLGIGKALAEWIPDATLRAFGGPMLILATPPNDTPAALYRLRTDIPHQIVSESGHWMQLDQPGIVEHAITTFVASLDRGTTSPDGRAH